MTLAVCDHAVDFEIEGLSVRHAKGAQLEFFCDEEATDHRGVINL